MHDGTPYATLLACLAVDVTLPVLAAGLSSVLCLFALASDRGVTVADMGSSDLFEDTDRDSTNAVGRSARIPVCQA